jgi:hypothetical protein
MKRCLHSLRPQLEARKPRIDYRIVALKPYSQKIICYKRAAEAMERGGGR